MILFSMNSLLFVNIQHCWLQLQTHHHGGFNGAHVHVNMNDQFAVIESVKAACSEVATTLCVELFYRFPDTEIMSTISIVYL